jgi:hypothetical protein
MASRDEVFEFMLNNYKSEKVADYTLKLVVPIDGRTQTVWAGVTEGELQMTSPFAWRNKIGADSVLDANKSMFGIVVINGAYALKHNVLIADVDESEVQCGFVTLAIYADELESKLGFDDEF